MSNNSTSMFKPSEHPLNLPEKTPTYMIAVPRCHENLFNHIRKNHEWLSSDGSSRQKDNEITYQKKISTQEELDKLEKLIMDLRLEKSEIFIDDSYHPKPVDQRTDDYVYEYLKNKSIHTYYTFKSYYRITVFPVDIPFGTGQSIEQRKEYLIVPLYIILKRGKTYDQMKTLSYKPDGSFEVVKVNPNHFWKVHKEDQEIIDEKNKEMREKVLSGMP